MKSKKHYRLMVGQKYCTLNHELHADGVAIPNAKTIEDAAVIEHVNTANAIIKRPHNLRDEISKSMYADWPKFAPIKFSGYVEHEEFQVQE